MSPVTITPHLAPRVGITIHHPEKDIALDDLDEASTLAQQLADAVKLLRYHVSRQAGGRATKGISTPAKRRAAKENGPKGGRPKGS